MYEKIVSLKENFHIIFIGHFYGNMNKKKNEK